MKMAWVSKYIKAIAKRHSIIVHDFNFRFTIIKTFSGEGTLAHEIYVDCKKVPVLGRASNSASNYIQINAKISICNGHRWSPVNWPLVT